MVLNIVSWYPGQWSVVSGQYLSLSLQDHQIHCSYYQLGILFMLLPVLLAIVFFTVLLVRESAEFESVIEYILIILIFGLLYLLVVPIVSIWFTARDLFSFGDSGDRDKDMDMVKVLKMFEHIGEALPQLILSCVFISYNGGPLEHPLNTTSALFSAVSLLYGLVLSADACIKSREQKTADRYRQTLGMPYT